MHTLDLPKTLKLKRQIGLRRRQKRSTFRARENKLRFARTGGFTLVELMIALVIVAILMAIAVPSYQEAVIKSRRADAKTALTDLANRLERYYAENNTYATATIASNPSTDVLSNNNSPEGYYTLSITTQDASSFTIKATRKATGPQASDTKCGDFTLTSTLAQGITGSGNVADCW